MNLTWCQQGRMGVRDSWGIWINMYTLLYLKWITNKVLLHGTGNSAQCYMAALDRREVWGRTDTCICMAESLCCPTATITTLLISYIFHYKIKFFKMNLQNIQTHIGKENKCMVIKGKGEWEKNKLRYGMERYTLPYIKIIKWINKYLLRSTKNYVQYLVTIYNANELKNNMYYVHT